ncbi:PRC and DUF2382 domain-containing protein [Roseisolibacter sp. H3M3-2]|uniref:PRC and DUF2382 domain-containing protein n=1 Tax=Roseisolibacter sp. H3M3-2 TaxID=3031323 RepID=UPI0023DAF19C|nr:PRC and DUF2382 domain-containing protein [Roseisolibacter sp. H3M3-2]MDF1503654.1 PRC and DUF2382 domain-containing protein [Roseisolibacter sp. H3M3-2]
MPYSSLSQHRNVQFPAELADVRGYEVRTRDDDDKVGRVDDLICSPDGSIRYLDVDLGGFFNTRHVALPIGAAQVDRANDVVWVMGMTKDQIKALPEYTGDAGLIDDGYESRTRGVYGSQAADRDLYDQGRFYAARGGEGAREARLVLSEEQLSVGKRQVQAGEVGIRKTVETEHVRESVPLMREEVTIERHPVSADAYRGDLDIGEDEIRVPLMREEAVVEKRVVPTEEVVLRKQAVTEQQEVEADLRRERAVVDDAAVRTRQGLAGTRVVGGASGASAAADRATNSGPADRLAGRADDLKDRVDGNPASRPGPDATDRRI